MSDHDHCDHDPIECTYDALVGEYHEAVAERALLRRAMEVQTAAADAAAEAVGAMAEKLSATLAENTRLRHLVADIFTALYPPVPTDPTSVSSANAIEYTELPAHVAALRAERDRLRAVVDAARAFLEVDESDVFDPDRVRLVEALDQLDVSPTMGGDDAEETR